MLTDFPIQAILDRLVGRIVDVLPISGAGVTLIAPGVDPQYIAASDEAALRFERLQTELGEGPCLAAFESDGPISVPDLRVDNRFPGFAARADEVGLVAVFTFPLRHGDEQLGALDLYRDSAGSLDAEIMAVAQTLADVAAAYLLNARSRDESRTAAAAVQHAALHDALTGLPNRTLLEERLVHAVQRSERSQQKVAILYADLDRFKAVNDTYGHHVGDELLSAVAVRLTGLLRPADTLARMGGDEFIVLCEDLSAVSDVEPIAIRIGRAFDTAFDVSTGAIWLGASIGIAFAGEGVDIPAQVMREADAAMYEAKRRRSRQQPVVNQLQQSPTPARTRER